ncbi:MAG: TonB-dependent receptor [Bacteroidales bacterium]|nr:TonB-dependent receptor [Bacteroidales bacterium]
MKKLLLIIVALFFFGNTSFCQDFLLSGEVKSSVIGKHVKNALISVKGSDVKMYSDNSGYFLIVIPEDCILIISAEGMQTKEVKISKEVVEQEEIIIELDPKAEGEFYEMSLEELMQVEVSTVSKKTQKISEAPAIVSVITAEEINELGIQTIPELMRYIPGFTVSGVYWRGPIVTARGVAMTLYNDKILMLIDGIPAYETVTLEYYLDVVPVSAIERIEIIRGPGSTLYGTNAFSAVINIITKSGNTFRGINSFVKYGSFNTRSAGFVVGDSLKFGSYLIGTTYTDNDGYNHTLEFDETGEENVNLNYENDIQNIFAKYQYKGLTLSGGYYFQNIAKFSMTTAIRYGSDQVPDAGMAEHRKAYLNAVYDFNFTNNFSGKVALHYDYMDKETGVGQFGTLNFRNYFLNDSTYPLDLTEIDPSFAAPNYSLYKGQLYNGELLLNYFINEQISVIGGINGELRDCDHVYTMLGERGGTVIPTHEGASEFPPNDVIDYAGYLQVDGTLFKRLGYIAGIRATYLGIPDNIYYTPRGGLVFGITDNASAKILYGEAFRGPGFQEQYFLVNAVTYGADAAGRSLEPERIKTYEAAFDILLAKKFSIRLNGFLINANELILRRPVDGSSDTVVIGHNVGMIYDNFGAQQIIGGEFEIKGRPWKKLNFFANFSYKEGIDEETNENLPYFINYTASGGLTFKPAKFIELSPNFYYIGDQKGNLGSVVAPAYTEGQEVNIDGYGILNCVMKLNFNKKLYFQITGINLTDKEYFYPEHIRKRIPAIPGGPGMSFYFSLHYKFGLFKRKSEDDLIN